MTLLLLSVRRRALASLAGLAIAGAVSGCGWQPPEGSTTFEIPTWEWNENDFALEALVHGILVLDDDGCTFLDASRTVGVMFPNAVGVTLEDGTRQVVDERTGKVFAAEGGTIEYGGGYGPSPDAWNDACSATPTEVATINDTPKGDPLRRG